MRHLLHTSKPNLDNFGDTELVTFSWCGNETPSKWEQERQAEAITIEEELMYTYVYRSRARYGIIIFVTLYTQTCCREKMRGIKFWFYRGFKILWNIIAWSYRKSEACDFYVILGNITQWFQNMIPRVLSLRVQFPVICRRLIRHMVGTI